jgi:hypothetical protein
VVKVSAQLKRSLIRGVAELDGKIEEAAAAHPDFLSLCRCRERGRCWRRACWWRLLAAGALRQCGGCARLQCDRAGNGTKREKELGTFSLAPPQSLQQTFHEWAGHSIAHSPWARSYYQQQRERGKRHHAAARELAFKWIRIVFRCWKDRMADDESRYLAALAKRNSPLTAVSSLTRKFCYRADFFFPGRAAGFSCTRSRKPPFIPRARPMADSPNLSRR